MESGHGVLGRVSLESLEVVRLSLVVSFASGLRCCLVLLETMVLSLSLCLGEVLVIRCWMDPLV